MRCVLASVSAAFLLAAALGCHHTAGRCDCTFDMGCGGCAGAAPVMKPVPQQAESIKVLPKAGESGPGK